MGERGKEKEKAKKEENSLSDEGVLPRRVALGHLHASNSGRFDQKIVHRQFLVDFLCLQPLVEFRAKSAEKKDRFCQCLPIKKKKKKQTSQYEKNQSLLFSREALTQWWCPFVRRSSNSSAELTAWRPSDVWRSPASKIVALKHENRTCLQKKYKVQVKSVPCRHCWRASCLSADKGR